MDMTTKEDFAVIIQTMPMMTVVGSVAPVRHMGKVIRHAFVIEDSVVVNLRPSIEDVLGNHIPLAFFIPGLLISRMSPVVIAGDKDLVPIETGSIQFYRTKSQREVSQTIDCIIRTYNIVPIEDEFLVHLFYGFIRTIAVSNDVLVVKMKIACKVNQDLYPSEKGLKCRTGIV